MKPRPLVPLVWAFERASQAFLGSAARWSRLFVLGVIVGVLAGLAAFGLHWALEHGTGMLIGRIAHLGGAELAKFHWGVLLLPALGGLLSGLAVQFFCPDALGHGTDALTRAFHRDQGAMPLKAPSVKALSAVGVISCGGSAGPEGPIAALGAGLGSVLGRVVGVTVHERRILLISGCAAGVGAIFQCPLGGALFAAGILYKDPEFETDAIVPGVVASVIGFSTFMMCTASESMEPLLPGAGALRFSSPLELLPYAVLGPLCGLMCILFSFCLRTVETRLLPMSRLPRWLAPMVGGLLTGGLACLIPQVMDGRYVFIKAAMAGDLFGPTPDWWWWTRVFAAVAIVKCIATALTVGSGASGGLLGPSVFIGGMMGAFLGALCEVLFPGTFPESLRQALIPVGMGGVLAAAMRTPLAAIVMVTEMTGSYGLIVPLMLVCVSSYVVGRGWGLNHEQVRTAADSPAHAADGIVHLLEAWRVSELMDHDKKWSTDPNESLRSIVERVEPGTSPVFAVLEGSRLAGLIRLPDLRRMMEEPGLGDALIASDMMTQRVATVHPDDDLYYALTVFSRHGHDLLPVVSKGKKRQWLGMLSRTRVYSALREQAAKMHESVLREHAGLSAIDQESQIEQLLMSAAPLQSERVQRLLVPLQAVGLSLREADVRRQFQIQVIAIEQPDGTLQCPPDLDAPLRTDQRLLAITWER